MFHGYNDHFLHLLKYLGTYYIFVIYFITLQQEHPSDFEICLMIRMILKGECFLEFTAFTFKHNIYLI